MIKKKLILADCDEMYLNSLSNYFMEKAPQLELNIFTRKDLLYQYLDKNHENKVLIVDEFFAGTELSERAGEAVKLVLSTTMTPVEGFEVVKKYQKAETLLSEILLKYAENTGSVEAIRGGSHTRLAAFYSPAGGTGKTVLALGMAAACAQAGIKTFYLNLEEVDSVWDILEPSAGSLSDIFLALKTKGMNAGLKLASCVRQESIGRFFYITGVESVSEYGEIDGQDVVRLLGAITGLAEYDLVILDTASGLSERTLKTLECADQIFTPVLSDCGVISKMQRFLREETLHEVYNPILRKMSLVINRSGRSGIGKELMESGILERLPCCAVITASPVFVRRADLLCSGELLRQMMGRMIEAAMGGSQ